MDDSGRGVERTAGRGRTLPPERPGMATCCSPHYTAAPQTSGAALIDGLHQAKPPNGGVSSRLWPGPSILSPSQRGTLLYCLIWCGRGPLTLNPTPLIKRAGGRSQGGIQHRASTCQKLDAGNVCNTKWMQLKTSSPVQCIYEYM